MREIRLVEIFLVCLVCLQILPHNVYSASLNRAEGRRRHKGAARKRHQSVYNSLPLKPSVVMIPLDLHETVNKDLDPDLDSLDTIALLNIMDSDYDKFFMSINQPLDMKTKPNGTLEYKFKRGVRPIGRMPKDLEILDSRSIKLSEDGPEIHMRASKKTRRKLQKFLWAYSYCPVRYKWKELSVRFWPRYIKVGSCENKRSCSFPAGMTCQPSKMTNIKLLRYYCPEVGSRRTCQWIKIQYPILTECNCGCQQYRDAD